MLSGIPAANNILCRSTDAARAFPQGDIELFGCSRCGYVWNAAFDPALFSYTGGYENNQSYSSRFVAHLHDVLRHLPLPEKDIHVVEIGCGQGYFLKFLRRRLASRLTRAAGYDPALREALSSDRLELIPGYFDALPWEAPTVVISRHTIEHVRDPVLFLQDIARIDNIEASVFETPDMRWIFDNKAYYDIYYEHPSLFFSETLEMLFRRFHFTKNISTVSLFDGQYLLTSAQRDGTQDTVHHNEKKVTTKFNKYFADFADGHTAYASFWRERLTQLRVDYGSVAVWGASSKGVTFARAVDSLVDFVIDINPYKQGYFLPCSALPVYAPDAAQCKKAGAIIVVNPSYFEEISDMCRTFGLKAHLIPLLPPPPP